MNAQQSRTTSGSLVVPARVHLQQRQTVTYICVSLNLYICDKKILQIGQSQVATLPELSMQNFYVAIA